ncbi:MAG: hypothetical protein WD801_10450, partial [Gemmatimonadaceae bacterium]
VRSRGTPPPPSSVPAEPYIMKSKDPKGSQEPVGIVISGMPPQSKTTVFSAYIWGAAPALGDNEPKAA